MTSSPTISLDSLLERAGRLYSLPTVAMKVLELTRNPQVDNHALKRCIENDPALTSKILRVVNSSLFGLSREVSDLNQALALLGTKPLKLLVLGFSLPAGLFGGVPAEALGHYWRRTLTKAVAARELSESVWRLPGDDAFIAGLLQDLGMLLLLQELGQPFAKFLEKVQACGGDLVQWETEALGCDHTSLSARLLAQWGLPDALVEAVSWESVEGSPRPLAQIVHLAELLARLLVDRRCEALEELLQVGGRYRDLTAEQVENLVAVLDEKVRQLADVLSLQLPGGTDYRDVLVQSQIQLAEVAADAAGELVQVRQDTAGASADESLLQEIRLLSKSLQDLTAPTRRTPSTAASPAAVDAPRTPAVVPQETSLRATGRAQADKIEPELTAALKSGVAACRRARTPLSLLLVELNHADQLLDERGAQAVELLRRLLEALCRRLDHAGMSCLAHGRVGFALILPDCDRRQAAEYGNQLIGAVRRLGHARTAGIQRAFSISVGAASVALAPKNFPAADLAASASRCLYGSRASGGSVMKSIEI